MITVLTFFTPLHCALVNTRLSSFPSLKLTLRVCFVEKIDLLINLLIERHLKLLGREMLDSSVFTDEAHIYSAAPIKQL